ncbi:MAG: hypothetical protein ACLP01_27190 [Solirubrobacteraceae bacterium]
MISPHPQTPGWVADPSRRAHHRYDALHGRLLLVRPDGHIAASAPLTTPEIVDRWMNLGHRSTESANGSGAAAPRGTARAGSRVAPPMLGSAPGQND